MKWKEFKELVEKQGVTNETIISYIDTSMYSPIVVYTDVDVHIE